MRAEGPNRFIVERQPFSREYALGGGNWRSGGVGGELGETNAAVPSAEAKTTN